MLLCRQCICGSLKLSERAHTTQKCQHPQDGETSRRFAKASSRTDSLTAALSGYRIIGSHPFLAEVNRAQRVGSSPADWSSRLFDLSTFIRELKGRFAQWYNRRHGRYGVL